MGSDLPKQVNGGKGQAQELCFCCAWGVVPFPTQRYCKKCIETIKKDVIEYKVSTRTHRSFS